MLRKLDLSDPDSRAVNRELFARFFEHLRRRKPHVMARPFLIDELQDRMKKILSGRKLSRVPIRSSWKFIFLGTGYEGDCDDTLKPCGRTLVEFFGFLDEFVEAQGPLALPIEYAVYVLANFAPELLERNHRETRSYLIPTARGKRDLRVCSSLLLPKIPLSAACTRSLFHADVMLAFSLPYKFVRYERKVIREL